MFGFHKDIWYKFTETRICAMNFISNYVGLRTSAGVIISTEQDFSLKRKFSNIIHNHIEYIIVWMCRSFRDNIYIAKINIIPETENLFS